MKKLPKTNPKLFIVIPTRNEEKVILKTLSEIKNKVKVPHKIIVVDDSQDKTPLIVKKYMRKHKNVTLVVNGSKKKSFAHALKIGFDRAGEGPIVTIMGDLCDDARTVNKMYQKYLQGYDLVCGSRYIKGGGRVGGPRMQGICSEIVCRTTPLLTGIKTHDVSNSFKLYRKSILRKIRFNLNSGPEISMEITLQAFFNGDKITEIPTVWRGRTMGTSKFNFIQRSPFYLRIYTWAIKNSIRKIFGLTLNKYTY